MIAFAVKLSAFQKTFRIECDGRQYELRARSFWRRELVLCEGEKEIGSVVPDSLFGRRARVSLPEDLMVVLRLFVVWLAMVLWKRDSDSAASPAA